MVSGEWLVVSKIRQAVLIFLLAWLVLVSCNAQSPPPDEASKPPSAKERVKPEEAAKPLEKITGEEIDSGLGEKKGVQEVLFYNPEGKRDPFLPFIAKTTPVVEETKPLSPLQRFDINQLKLVAIIWGIDNPIAMVEDPEGKGYTIKRGILIGRRNGKVVKILKDKVIIEERFQDALGKLKTEEVILELPKEEEILIE